MNPFGHIDLRVADLAAAEPFYDALLPELGFTERYHGESWKVRATTEPLPGTAYFAVTENTGHLPNENRIAFRVASREDVERVAAAAGAAGVTDRGLRPSAGRTLGERLDQIGGPLGSRLTA